MQIVMTGYGAVTPMGLGVDSLWSGLIEGRSGARELEGDTWKDLPVRIAAPVSENLETILGHPKARQLDRSQQFALVASAQAWEDAGSPDVDPERLAVVVGTGIGGVTTLLGQDDILEARGARRVSPRAVPMLMPNGAAAQVSIEYHAQAGAYTTVSACASGAEAITMAARLIACGEADVVIAGGTEAAVTPLTLAAFSQATALAKPEDAPEQVSRPFSADRHGFLLGEGAGMVIMESAEHAAARHAQSHATLAGWSVTSDAYHVTATEPTGAQQVRAIRTALSHAGLAPADVDLVNAHATSTTVGDLSEANAVETILGTDVPVTAPKSSIGHLLGGAGAVETIATVRSIETGLIPPTLNLDEPDPQIHINVVHGSALRRTVDTAINNSFGFGGQNVTLALTR